MKLFTLTTLKPMVRRLALIGLIVPAGVHALTLGELELQSYVGQPFRAQVPYKTNAGESLTLDCLSLSQASGDLPSLGSASISLISRGDHAGMLLISSRQAIGEPTVGFGIQVDCNGVQLSRSFTAFLNVAPLNEPKPAPQLTIAKPAQPPRISTAAADLPNRDPQTLTVKKTTTLAELTKKYYPENTPQYPRFLNKLINVNPGYSDNTPIAAGTSIVIPDRLRSSKKAPSKTSKLESGLLRLDGEPQAPVAKPKTTVASSSDYTRELEQKVLELNELQQKMQLEITQLNLRLAQMSPASTVAASAINPQASANPSTIASTASVVVPAHAAPATRFIPSAATDDSVEPDYLLWGGAMGAVLIALGAGWWFIRRRSQQQWQSSQYTEQDFTQFGPNPTFRPPAGLLSRNTMMSMMHLGGTPHGIEVEETAPNDLARAHMLIAQGEVMDAIDVLYHCIDEDPEDIERWLMLFRLFRQQGMKSEYAQLAQNLKAIPHDAADWELVRNIGAKLDPENPLYIRETQSATAPQQHTASYAQAFGLNEAAPVAEELKLDLEAPISPDLSMMVSLSTSNSVPPQYESLLIKPANPPEIDHSIELPDLDSGHTLPDLSLLEEQTPQFEVEELNLQAISSNDGLSTLEFDLTPNDKTAK